MLYFVKWAHLLIKIRVINTNMRRLIAALSNGRRPLRFKLDQHRHIHINYTCLNRIWPLNGNDTVSFYRLNRNDNCLYTFHLTPKYEIYSKIRKKIPSYVVISYEHVNFFEETLDKDPRSPRDPSSNL